MTFARRCILLLGVVILNTHASKAQILEQQILDMYQQEVMDPGFSACLPSVFDDIRKLSNSVRTDKLAKCKHFIETKPDSITPEELFAVYLEKFKLQFLTRDHATLKDDLDTLADLATTTASAEDRLVVRVLKLMMELWDGGDTAELLQEAKALSDTNPNFLPAHLLYENLAFMLEEYELSREATKRQLRLRPNKSSLYNLALTTRFDGDPETSKKIILNAVDTAERKDKVTTLLLEYARAVSTMGNFDEAQKILTILDADTAKEDRQKLKEDVFSDYPSLYKKPFRIDLTLRGQEKVSIEVAINLVELGDSKGAMKKLEEDKITLFCQDLRCLKLEAAIAEEKGDTVEADRIRRRIERSKWSLKRSPLANWEKSLILELPYEPYEKFLYSKNYQSPDITSFKGADGTIVIQLKNKRPSSIYSLSQEVNKAAQKIIKDKGYDDFIITDLETKYSYRRVGSEKEFVEHQLRLSVAPLGAGVYDTISLVPWRLYGMSR